MVLAICGLHTVTMLFLFCKLVEPHGNIKPSQFKSAYVATTRCSKVTWYCSGSIHFDSAVFVIFLGSELRLLEAKVAVGAVQHDGEDGGPVGPREDRARGDLNVVIEAMEGPLDRGIRFGEVVVGQGLDARQTQSNNHFTEVDPKTKKGSTNDETSDE